MGKISGIEVLGYDERKIQEESELIASALRNATIAFLDTAQNAKINLDCLNIKWEYNDGKHIINGGV